MFTKIKKWFSPPEPEKPEMIVITLEELANRIWLKHNASFEPVPCDEEDLEVSDKSNEEEVTQSVQAPLPISEEQEGGKPVKTHNLSNKVIDGSKLDSSVFFQDFVDPYKNVYIAQKAYAGVGELINLLDEHGNCPSVVITAARQDCETEDIHSIKNILLKVTLKDHTFRVAKIALKLLREQYRDFEMLVPKTIVAAMGHDVGKMPILRESGLYTKADHPLISAAKVEELFARNDIFWLNSVLNAINNHHKYSKDQFDTLIRDADKKARELEVANYSKDLSVKPWEEWFNVDRILEMVLPYINVMQNELAWKAFSFNGTVYCQPDLIYELTKKLAIENKIIDLSITRLSEKELVLRRVADSLRQRGYISIEIDKNFYGSFFVISNDKFKKKFYLIPIKISAFNIPPHDIEKAKEGYLQLIREVTIANGR